MDDISSDDTTELMDLPEPVLVNILSYVDYDCLRHSVAHVSQAFQELAHTPFLWRDATLFFNSEDCWEDTAQETFARALMATPHLRRLSVTLGYSVLGVVKEALINSRCRLHALQLEVDQYGPESLLLLQRHPEIRELSLTDHAEAEGIYEAAVAKAVSVLAPRLTHLDLSASRLLSLPAVGDLLSEKRALRSFADSATWAPAVHSSVYPAGGEPEQPEQSEEEEDEDAMGLRHLTFEPRCSVEYWGDVDAMRAVCCRLARLIRRHHGTLRRVEVNAPGREVYSALAECSSLERLSVTCDEDGQLVTSLMQGLERQPSLRRLRLRLGAMAAQTQAAIPQPQAARLATLLRKVAELPHLQVLDLHGGDTPATPHGSWPAPFPGLEPLRQLLGQQSQLRELHLTEVTPAGRDLLEELRRLAPPALRLLLLTDCPCSDAGGYWSCRDRAADRLEKELPSLEVRVDNALLQVFDDRYDVGFLPIYTCQCDQKKPRLQL